MTLLIALILAAVQAPASRPVMPRPVASRPAQPVTAREGQLVRVSGWSVRLDKHFWLTTFHPQFSSWLRYTDPRASEGTPRRTHRPATEVGQSAFGGTGVVAIPSGRDRFVVGKQVPLDPKKPAALWLWMTVTNETGRAVDAPRFRIVDPQGNEYAPYNEPRLWSPKAFTLNPATPTEANDGFMVLPRAGYRIVVIGEDGDTAYIAVPPPKR